MKKLLRTLYILTPDSYLYWRNENVCIKVGGTEKVAIPALTLDAIVCKPAESTGSASRFSAKEGSFRGVFTGRSAGMYC